MGRARRIVEIIAAKDRALGEPCAHSDDRCYYNGDSTLLQTVESLARMASLGREAEKALKSLEKDGFFRGRAVGVNSSGRMVKVGVLPIEKLPPEVSEAVVGSLKIVSWDTMRKGSTILVEIGVQGCQASYNIRRGWEAIPLGRFPIGRVIVQPTLQQVLVGGQTILLRMDSEDAPEFSAEKIIGYVAYYLINRRGLETSDKQASGAGRINSLAYGEIRKRLSCRVDYIASSINDIVQSTVAEAKSGAWGQEAIAEVMEK